MDFGFRICGAKGFQIKFENGWTASVQFGQGNYCDNRSPQQPSEDRESRSAEIAAWDAAGKWYQFESDEVEGWQSPSQVLEFLNMIAGKS